VSGHKDAAGDRSDWCPRHASRRLTSGWRARIKRHVQITCARVFRGMPDNMAVPIPEENSLAKTNRVVLTCDLHGDDTDAVATIQIANGTVRYELDVCQEHLEQLTGTARRVRPRKSTGAVASPKRRTAKRATRKGAATGRRSRPRERVDTTGVREWARANGYTVGDRGRIPGPVVEAFTASR
jgi:hypothetical protein